MSTTARAGYGSFHKVKKVHVDPDMDFGTVTGIAFAFEGEACVGPALYRVGFGIERDATPDEVVRVLRETADAIEAALL